MKTVTIQGASNYTISEDGTVTNKTTGDILTQGWSGEYHQYLLMGDNGKRTKFFTHRLLATAFLPNPFNLPIVNHLDANKLNNEISNLEFTTSAGNKSHAKQFGEYSSKYPGVCKTKSNTWRVRIMNGKVYQHIGTFKDEVEAYEAYKQASVMLGKKNQYAV